MAHFAWVMMKNLLHVDARLCILLLVYVEFIITLS